MYATVDDLRGEGVTEEQASDDRITELLGDASLAIERATHQFFEPRQLTLRLDGRGVPSLDLPYHPIEITSIEIDGTAISLDDDVLIVVGAPGWPPLAAPRVTLTSDVFPRGRGNVKVTGTFGYTEADGTAQGRTPREIRRACMMLALRRLPLLGDVEARDEAERGHLVTSEKTRDQSYSREADRRPAPFTGDPEVDAILLDFQRPFRLGAA